jgi:hypothetical protein
MGAKLGALKMNVWCLRTKWGVKYLNVREREEF